MHVLLLYWIIQWTTELTYAFSLYNVKSGAVLRDPFWNALSSVSSNLNMCTVRGSLAVLATDMVEFKLSYLSACSGIIYALSMYGLCQEGLELHVGGLLKHLLALRRNYFEALKSPCLLCCAGRELEVGQDTALLYIVECAFELAPWLCDGIYNSLSRTIVYHLSLPEVTIQIPPHGPGAHK